MNDRSGPAFPRPFSWDVELKSGTHMGDRPEPAIDQQGMTLRQWYAGQAMLMASILTSITGSHDPSFAGEVTTEGVVKAAFEIADAMIAESQK